MAAGLSPDQGTDITLDVNVGGEGQDEGDHSDSVDADPVVPVFDGDVSDTEPAEGVETVEATEAVEIVDPDPAELQPSDISYNLAVIFVLSMILGVLIFSNLSRRWHT